MSDLISRQEAIEAVNETIAQYIPYLTRETIGIPLEVALAIKRLPSANQWIKCSERLPDEAVEVFIYVYGNVPVIAWVESGRWYTEDYSIDEDDNPLAWMELPQPFRGDE